MMKIQAIDCHGFWLSHKQNNLPPECGQPIGMGDVGIKMRDNTEPE
jgi:hypothetical protein